MRRTIIVGAGLAGLTCATLLHGHGQSPLVLEAEPSVGGRVKSVNQDGFILDRGFQVLFPAYPRVREHLDLAALHPRAFHAGAIILRDGRRTVLANPLTHPRYLLPTLDDDEIVARCRQARGRANPAACLAVALLPVRPAAWLRRSPVRQRNLRAGLDPCGRLHGLQQHRWRDAQRRTRRPDRSPVSAGLIQSLMPPRARPGLARVQSRRMANNHREGRR